jgi:hypothetical protein
LTDQIKKTKTAVIRLFSNYRKKQMKKEEEMLSKLFTTLSRSLSYSNYYYCINNNTKLQKLKFIEK